MKVYIEKEQKNLEIDFSACDAAGKTIGKSMVVLY